MSLYWWAEAIYIQGYWKMCSISCNLICLVSFNYIFSNFSAVSIRSLLLYWVGLNRFSLAFCSFIPLMKFIPSHALTIDAVCLLLQCWLDGYRLPWCVFVLRCSYIFLINFKRKLCWIQYFGLAAIFFQGSNYLVPYFSGSGNCWWEVLISY